MVKPHAAVVIRTGICTCTYIYLYHHRSETLVPSLRSFDACEPVILAAALPGGRISENEVESKYKIDLEH